MSAPSPAPAPAPLVAAPAPVDPLAIAPTPKPRPADPLMGTTEETYPGSGSYYYSFGGEPKLDWSGIKDPSSRLLTDLCYRSLDPVAGQKSTIYRTKGLEKKYERTEKLSDFQKKIWEHFKMCGMDTITYLPDPKDSTKAQSTVMFHARFTGDLDKSVASSEIFKGLFDTWDKKNDYEAKKFLLNSLSDSIKESFETFNSSEDSFSATWLKLVHYLVTTTSKTYDRMKESIRNKRPQQYPGQDIEKMAKDFIKLAHEMDNAGHYSHGLTLNMVDGFLHASKDHKGTFHHELNNLRSLVSRKEQETIFLSVDDQSASFAKDSLSYRDVCLHAVKLYNELLSNNMWEPGKLPKDRQAPAAPSTNLTKAQVLTLIENASKGGSSTRSSNKKFGGKSDGKPKGAGLCYNCGEKGHLIKDCPKPKASPDQARINRHKSMSPWKLVAPSSGESNTKTVNGRSFKWCAKCMNWTTTHDTQGHTGGSNSGPSKKKAAETNLAAWEPHAWLIEAVPPCPSPSIFNSVPSFIIWIYILITIMYFGYFLLVDPQAVLSSVLTVLRNSSLNFSVFPTVWDWIVNSVAPCLWFALGYCVCYLRYCTKPSFNPIIDAVPLTRGQRRRQVKKVKWKVKSARDHDLRPSYPLRL